MKYDHKKIEKKWQKRWLKDNVYEPNLDKAKKPFYNLMMFPYPSAEGLHVGNMYAFTGADIFGRTKRMQGYDVFEPIGLDGFGIHSENYALKVGKHPRVQAKISEKNFYRQLQEIGNGFAWKEKLETYDPAYYKWTQWIFTEMFRRGLAYRKKQAVNWCPSDKTVLADEQVIAGKCERDGATVEKRELEQWFFKITDYADRLLNDLEKLDWSEKVKIAQRNWIGKSEGAEIDFPLTLPQPKGDIVFATSNKGKVKRMERLFKAAGLKLNLKTPEEIGITDFDVVENGATLAENAEKKARALAAKTDLMVFAEDSGFFIDGASIDPVTVKRNALAGVDEKKLSIEEIALRMQKYYENIASEHGGKVDAEWRNALCVITPEKIAIHVEVTRLVILTNESHGKADPYLPLRNLYISKATGKYVLEQSDAEELKELEPITSGLKKLFSPHITVFTTRPDTIFGATYMVLAPEHPFISAALSKKNLIENENEVTRYIENAKKKTQEERIENKEKTGVFIKGIRAINPATKEEIPIWVSDYVLGSYGTGAIMAVPAHDERDFEFAQKFKLPIKTVVEPKAIAIEGESAVKPGMPFVKREAICAIVRNPKNGTYLCISWKGFSMNGLVTGGAEEGEDLIEAAAREVREETGYKHLRFVKHPSIALHSLFYHRVKKENRWARFQYFFFDLEDEARDPVNEKEAALHEVVWKKKEELKNFFTVVEGKFLLDLIENPNFIYTGEGVLNNSGRFSDLDSEVGKAEITKFVGGEEKKRYRLRDWLISRQRYWGPPIPMIHCETCAGVGRGERKDMPGWYAVPQKDLPVKLPNVKNFRPTGTGESPLASVKSFYEAKCPACKSKARRETDVSDTFLDSAWYYIGYLDLKNPFDKTITKKWLPIDMYTGGAEHSVLHLLYFRFFAKVFHDWKIVDFDEPTKKFRAHGLLIREGKKISKSKGNIINPDDFIKEFGADALRMHLMFLGPFEDGGDFHDQGILGPARFLERTWKLGEQISKTKAQTKTSPEVEKMLHKTIKKVTEDIEKLHYNTAISSLMVLLNEFEKQPISDEVFGSFLKLLAPFAPHITEELWAMNEHKTSIHIESLPTYDASLIEETTIELIVQVNGKLRDTIQVNKDISQSEAEKIALQSEKVKAFIPGKPKKIIFVPGRLINFVV